MTSILKMHKPRAALVTYGKTCKPLPLTGKQFFRAAIFDFPLDQEAGCEEDVTRTEEAIRRESADSADSPLSDAESVEQVSSPIRGSQQQDARTRKTLAASSTHGPSNDRIERISRGLASHILPRSSKVERPSATISGQPTRLSASKTRKRKPARAVSELLLVTSPVHVESEANLKEPGILEQDPLEDGEPLLDDSRASARDRDSLDAGTVARAPLSVIRQRLKSVKLQSEHSISNKGRSGRGREVSFLPPSVGDGFEAAERIITTHGCPKRRTKRRAQSGFEYAALQLDSGPLPAVCLEKVGQRLDIAHPSSVVPSGLVTAPEDHQERTTMLKELSPVLRKISFSNRDRLISAQLSSISAPQRSYSDSEDEESEDDDRSDAETALTDDSDNVDRPHEHEVHNAEVDQEPALLSHHTDKADDDNLTLDDDGETPAALQDRTTSVVDLERDRQPHPRSDDDGIRLDFRRNIAPSNAPRSKTSRRRLIEVDERIDDDEPDYVYAHTPKRRACFATEQVTVFEQQDTPHCK